jgi:hypothetical protein
VAGLDNSKAIFYGRWDTGGAAVALTYAMPIISETFKGFAASFGECRSDYIGQATGAKWELFVIDATELKRLGLKTFNSILFYDADTKKIVGKIDGTIDKEAVKNSLYNLFMYGTQYGKTTGGTPTGTGGKNPTDLPSTQTGSFYDTQIFKIGTAVLTGVLTLFVAEKIFKK